MTELKNKKILVFYPKGATAHYGLSIIEELKKRGNIVIAYDERPSQTPIIKIATRLLKKRVPQFFANYVKKIIRVNKSENFDYVLILRGEAFGSNSLALLRKAFPNAFFILYLWDVLHANDLTDILHLFDRTLSFDPDDAEKQKEKNLLFRPTFYLNEFLEISEKAEGFKYDVFFVGTLRPERHILLDKIKKSVINGGNTAYFYYYISSVLVYLKNKIKHKSYTAFSEVSATPLAISDILECVKYSKCVLDLRYDGQISLSMRAYETMAAKRKYITNNPNIKNYEFYNENNVLIIDDDNPSIPKAFMDSKFEDIPIEIQRKYSLKQWVDDVFNLKSV